MLAVRLIPLAAVLALGALAARAGEPAFVGGFDDLPLMAGLAEIEGAGVVFDTPDGRIVERYAAGAVAGEEVARFYRAALPALGWRASGPLGWRREGEQLSITVFPPEASGRITVRFSLAPG